MSKNGQVIDVSRPIFIKHISLTLNNIQPADFLAFKDSKELIELLLSRQEDWLTIFESGDEWVDGYPDHFNTYYTFNVFLADKKLSEPQVNHFLKNAYSYFRQENLYRSEIFNYFDKEIYSSDFKNGIYPIIGASPKNFRLEKDEALAIVLPHVLSGMDLTQVGDSLNFNDADKDPAIELIEWQGVYKEHSSRRFQPDAKGTTLNIRREILKRYVQQANKDLYLHIVLRRSMDRYKPEANMDWRNAEFIRKISL
jgi:hypothetical protein